MSPVRLKAPPRRSNGARRSRLSSALRRGRRSRHAKPGGSLAVAVSRPPGERGRVGGWEGSEEGAVDDGGLLCGVGPVWDGDPVGGRAAEESRVAVGGGGGHVWAGVGPAVLCAGFVPEGEAGFAGEAFAVGPPGAFLAVGGRIGGLRCGRWRRGRRGRRRWR